MYRIVSTCWAVALVFAIGGCELFRDLDEVRLEEARCETGVTVECVCENGATGTQTCTADNVYEPCRCAGDAGPETGADGAEMSDSQGSKRD